MSAAETTSHVSTKTAQVRNRWIRNIEAAIKAGVPKHVKDGLETAIKQIKGSIEFGGKGHLQERIGLLEYELACASLQWQPIETAPKDGKSILVCNHKNGVTQCAVYLSKRWLTTWQHEEITTDPTHWMPLPAPPSQEGAT